MSLPAKCRTCGHGFIDVKILPGTGTVSVSGLTVRCPICGSVADIQDGKYEFVNNVIQAFTAPGMTRAKVIAARNLVREASSGTITSDAALDELKRINESLAIVVQNSGAKRINWELLLTLFALILAIWTDQKSDAAAKADLAEAQTQTELLQKLLEESKAQTKSLCEFETKRMLQLPSQAQLDGAPNRHERRKKKSVNRKQENQSSKPPFEDSD